MIRLLKRIYIFFSYVFRHDGYGRILPKTAWELSEIIISKETKNILKRLQNE